MKDHAIIMGALLVTSTLGAGCKSVEDKCRDTAETTYAEKSAACKDDACKKELENKQAWVARYVDMCRIR